MWHLGVADVACRARDTGNVIAGERNPLSGTLVVDDIVAGCRTLELHLRSRGYEVAVVRGVDAGLESARVVRPDLLIMDIRMPGRSGLN